MSLSNVGPPTNDKKLGITRKAKTLNPNAAEFIPSALRSSSGSTSTADVPTSLGTSATGTGALGKTVLDRSGSSISNNSDEEAHKYWRHQLPDDITPDFNITGEDESEGINSIHFSTLDLHDSNEISRFSASTGSGSILKERHELSSHGSNGSIAEKMAYSVSSGEDTSSANLLLHFPTKPRCKLIGNNNQLLTTVRDRPNYDGNPRHGLLNERAVAENMEMNPLDFLALQFPGFATASLAEVYFANGGDLNLTIEMLNQLELQVDSGLDRNLNSKALSATNPSTLDFPVFSVQDGQHGLPKFDGAYIQQTVSPHRFTSEDSLLLFKSNPSIPTRGSGDFASVVRKMSSQDSGTWKYDRNGSADASVGSSRSAQHVLASSYKGGQGRGIFGDRLQSRSSSWAAPKAVANLYSEMRDEARDHDHACLRNAYLEQARQAYLIGNNTLAKEPSVKGQLHNIQMKSAHGKVQESIYRQRNPISPPEMQQHSGRGQEKIIDLHGLHVSEAIHMLKHELGLLRTTVGNRLQVVYICVGTGHHTKCSRNPARLPIAVQCYLLEEEGLEYSEPQPGLLRVVIC
ncbi:polyadenylate-binding protein-interacting protein 7-like isoform X2 [Actinidia eriantha]|uniref:polyadenylate-binding protein-interacting protein 7-like isoform X2 n=1 Tax=Actinidia eriantha TaxID=165200 RepID=UPI00258AAE97|nr:polyadenylate-binding protein-interacting protein 7-like isoform X2 [Actinidia eriantha]